MFSCIVVSRFSSHFKMKLMTFQFWIFCAFACGVVLIVRLKLEDELMVLKSLADFPVPGDNVFFLRKIAYL